jgi:hypothetical protein
MFRDPAFFLALREHVVPVLKTYPSPTIWVAGCCTGEEALSLAIVLHEEGLLERCRIYATDINPQALATAAAGVYPLHRLEEYGATTGPRAAWSGWTRTTRSSMPPRASTRACWPGSILPTTAWPRTVSLSKRN